MNDEKQIILPGIRIRLRFRLVWMPLYAVVIVDACEMYSLSASLNPLPPVTSYVLHISGSRHM